jgi:hypothetical protein
MLYREDFVIQSQLTEKGLGLAFFMGQERGFRLGGERGGMRAGMWWSRARHFRLFHNFYAT